MVDPTTAQALAAIFNKETVFFGLFAFLGWKFLQEKDKQNEFIVKQQEILQGFATTLEKLTGRIENIESNINDIKERNDK